MTEPARLELRRPRNSPVTRERIKQLVMFIILCVLLWILVDMTQDFRASMAGKNDRRTFLSDNPDETPSAKQTLPERTGKESKTTVYFLTAEQPTRLVARQLSFPSNKSKKIYIGQLIDKMQGSPPSEELRPPLPHGTKLLAIFLRGKDLYIDLSSELYRKHSGYAVECYATLQAVTNTLTSLEFVDRVKFLVSGKERLTLLGHFDLMSFWYKDMELVFHAETILPHE